MAVLTGAGGTFCAGADLKAVAEGDRRPIPDHGPGPMGPTRLTLSKPVIAAVEGYAVAGGIELALWCDLRVAAEDAVFGVFCRRFGVPLCDLGTVRLPRIVGHGRAMDLILTGRAVTAPEALQHRVWPTASSPPGRALAAAVELAHQLAALPQFCLRSDRMCALEQWGLTEEEAAVNEARRGRDVISSGETLDGAHGSLEGRDAVALRSADHRDGDGDGGASGRPTVAAFDFDGTLTDAGSVFPFLVSLRGLLPVLRAVVRLSPALLRAAITGGPAADDVKERLFSRLLGGMAVTRWTAARPPSPAGTCRSTCATTPGGAWSGTSRQGHHTVIVSASPECYVAPAGEELGVDGVVATRLAVGGGGSAHRRLRGQELPGGGEVRPPGRLPARPGTAVEQRRRATGPLGLRQQPRGPAAAQRGRPRGRRRPARARSGGCAASRGSPRSCGSAAREWPRCRPCDLSSRGTAVVTSPK